MTATGEGADNGLGVLRAEEIRLMRVLDDLILSWAEQFEAEERRYPVLLKPQDLDSIDYYDNFPQLGLAVSTTDPEQLTALLGTTSRPLSALPARVLDEARLNLPSAACYAVYFDLRGQTLPSDARRFTTVATCFRNETRFEGMRRLLGFSMREIVFVGTADGAKDHLQTASELVLDLSGKLGLTMRKEPATDPFFDSHSSRAKIQQIFPVKEEFIVDGLAVGSVNYHRNFFGDRCDISLPNGRPAHTSCLAFGLERWVHVLKTHFGDAKSATEAVLGVQV